MALRLIVGGERVDTDAFEYTAVDPGGFETLSATLPTGTAAPAPGAEVLVLDGLEIAWHGHVEEPGQDFHGDQATVTIQAVGKGALLKRNPYSMVYMDRALSRFGQISRQRALNLATSDYSPNAGTVNVEPDAATGNPSLVMALTRVNQPAGAFKAIAETLYDAGEGNRIARVSADYETYDKAGGGLNALSDANWVNQVALATDDTIASTDASGNLGTNGSVTVTATAARRIVMAQLYYSANLAETEGDWRFMLKNLRVIGDHGLTIRTDSAGVEGLAPEDVAADAIRRSRAGFDIDIPRQDGYLLPHLVYYTPVQPEQIVDEMAKLLGWHWGVWEPGTLGGSPRALVQPPPVAPTAEVSRRHCDGLQLAEQLSRMHNRCLASYQLPDGTAGTVAVERPHPRLPAEAVQTLELPVGVVGSAAAAETIAAYTLALDQAQSRAAGQGVLPDVVRTPGGGRRPAHRLKPGRDRLRVADLGIGSIIDDSAAAVETFRIRRTTVTVQDGQPRTRVELDDGSSLIETMQARLAVAAAVAGV